MRALLIAALLSFGLLAGCADEPDPAPAYAQPDAPVAPGSQVSANVTVAATANASTEAGFTIDASGAGGSWIVIFHPMEPTSTIEASYSHRIQSQEGPSFWVPPTFVREQDGGWELEHIWPFDVNTLQREAMQEEASGRYSSAGGTMVGVFSAFAAAGPWSLSIEYRWGEGDLGAPEFVHGGDDAIFHLGGEHTLPVDGAVADQVTLAGSVAVPGWTHLEVIDQPFQPVEVRQHSYGLPNGHGHDGMSTMYGYYALGGSAGSSGRVDYVGSLRGVAGDVRGEITYASGSLGVDLGFVHLPMTQWPPGLATGNYAGDSWPFPDDFPPSPP